MKNRDVYLLTLLSILGIICTSLIILGHRPAIILEGNWSAKEETQIISKMKSLLLLVVSYTLLCVLSGTGIYFLYTWQKDKKK